MEFIKLLQKFEKDGKKLLNANQIKDIIFSDNIYETQVRDSKLKTSFWPFLQIDKDKNILDAFCSCKTGEKQGFCEHLAAAFFYITKKNEPIHVRFKKSFFNALFKIVSFYIGFEKKNLKKKKNGSYFYLSSSKKEFFYIETKGKEIERLEEYLKEKKEDKDALKYSAISLDDMNLIKEGRASDALKYEMSFFSDLAKWFFLLAEDNKYKIEFKEQQDGLYSQVIVIFADIFAKFYIPFSSFEEIVPTLNTVEAKLKLYEFQGKKIEKILYDRAKKSFSIEKTKGFFEEEKEQKKGIKVGSYIYVEGIGFYPQKPNELLKTDIIETDKISYFLTKYKNIFEEKIENEKFFLKPYFPKYFLYFDEDQNLHIKMYVFEKMDFEKPFSCFFGSWAYIQDKGFYLLEDLFFEEIEEIITKENLSEFITENRIWLHNFEGFQTHFGAFQSHLVYTLTKDLNLVFSSKLEFPGEFENFIDFEEWIYIKGIGFFSKVEKRLNLPIRPGLSIKKEKIAKFIKSNREELEQIDNFFIENSPIEKIGLRIVLNEDYKIVITPEIKVKEGFDIKNFQFFENFMYLKDRGFFEITKSLKLPEMYEKEKIVTKSNEAFFITFELQRLKPYIIFLDKRLEKPKSLSLKLAKIVKRKRKSKTIYQVNLEYQSEIGKVNALDMQKAIIENKKYIFSKAGLMFFKQARFNWLKNLKKPKKSQKDQFLELTSIDIIRLFMLEDVKVAKTKDAEQTKKLLNELQTFETDKFCDISLLKASLWPYQEIGIKWLWFLYVNNLSGLLCDDMGLGKTHQSMALIAAIHKEKNFKFLVVCPTSVIYHWEELLKKFLPSIRVYVYHGVYRKLDKFTKDCDLLLTSYGIIRSEKDKLKKLKFELAIFDEIQIAKNINSLTHRALSNINATMRLGLTGTPIENYLIELKSIFDVVLPTYLPSVSVFKEFFVTPIEKGNDLQRQKLLKKLIKPFILRRRKKDVLFDLPEKIEEIAYTDLSSEQRHLYNEIIAQSKKTIIKDLKDGTKKVSYIHIFSLLTKLKQVCDHPSLILKDIDKYTDHESGKFELFIELLNEAKESSQKVVVFSQYLNMIEIIKKYLKKKSIGYACITGATKKRFKEIKKFKEDPECLVFVASLLAAGVGIDLSAGSVVIHFDRWWNPAKENQATDRVHRIGQNRGVQVFKLVTKNTIEERIHTIIERKKHLIEETIGVDEADQIKSLTREDLIEVLEKLEG